MENDEREILPRYRQYLPLLFMKDKKMKKRIYATGIALCALMLCISLFQIIN